MTLAILESHDGDRLDDDALPDALVGTEEQIDEALAERWYARIRELLTVEPEIAEHQAQNEDGTFPFSPVSCSLCRRIYDIELQAARDVGAVA